MVAVTIVMSLRKNKKSNISGPIFLIRPRRHLGYRDHTCHLIPLLVRKCIDNRMLVYLECATVRAFKVVYIIHTENAGHNKASADGRSCTIEYERP